MKVIRWRRAQNLAILNGAKRRMLDPTKCHIVILGGREESHKGGRAAWCFMHNVSSREGKLALVGGVRQYALHTELLVDIRRRGY